ncbi:rab guanine nucleotide exchange factor S2 [Teratosphaeriaceae sp. CCFEE 6253]|nr:rab guanine nucleotide exchange factor S2 [Teratosphaeriaceae sp. CCFEE 6253]
MAAAAVASPASAMRDTHTIMDTRTPSPVQRNRSVDSTATNDEYKPDLSAEVAMLSTKLVNAINYQTNLDDSLQQSRHDLDSAQKELARVRQQKGELDNLITGGVLLRKRDVDQTMAALRAELEKERAAREEAEKSKKATEGELETLTAALFEEANTMVAAARRDTEQVERRERQVRTQLEDTELLLASQTEQLRDLKGVMERLERQSEYDGLGRGGEASMPVTPVDASRTAAWDAALQFSPSTAGTAMEPVQPDHPLHFTHLLAPIMRTDVTAYFDFRELLALSRRTSPHSRQASNSTTNLSSLSQSQTNLGQTSSPNLPGAFFSSGTSANTSPSSATFQPVGPPLKESRFYKRALAEDIEPTLRLDLAPGLSFLSRRSVLSALLNGSLVVEPFNAQVKQYGLGAVFACALCGESRKTEPVGEDEGAQRYALCEYCVGRVRASGDFVGFLRLVRDGHWRCEGEGEERGAWEEATRLRERMFWARVGGGVVPAVQVVRGETGSVRGVRSARASLESVSETRVNGRRDVEGLSGSSHGAAQEGAGSTRMEAPHTTVPAGRERSTSAIARAIMGAPSGVIATGRPDVQPQPDEREMLESRDEAASDSVALTEPHGPDTEPTTPMFEDAHDDIGSQELQHQADAQLLREASQDLPRPVSSEPQHQQHRQPIPTVHEPTPEPETDQGSAHAGPEKGRPAVLDRRPSGVLARVRAMEAQASAGREEKEKKLPGAFE